MSRRISLTAAAALIVPMLTIAPASATPLACGATVVTDVVLEADLLCSGVDGLIVGADGIDIDLDGHVIRNTGGGVPTGLTSDGFSGVTVRNGVVRGFLNNIAFTDSPGATVASLTVRDGDTGVALVRSPASSITDVVARGNAEAGYAVTLSDGSTIENSVGRLNTVGAFILSNDVTVRDSVFTDNLRGIDVQDVSGLAVERATLRRNTDAGLAAFHAPSLMLNDSRLRQNGVGARFGGDSNGTMVSGNIIAANGVGLLLGRVDGAVVADNTVRKNSASGVVVDQDDFVVGFVPGVISGNSVRRNGDMPGGLTDTLGELLDDGIHIYAPPGVVIVRDNAANRNGDYGIAAGVATDGGGNTARRNGNPLQCTGVACG